MSKLQEILNHFDSVNHVVLASAEGDQPRLRPITLINQGDRFFFATQSSDSKVKQLLDNPKIELILQWREPPNNGYVRLEGTTEKLVDENLVSKLYFESGFIEKLWSSPNDSNLTIFEVLPTMYDYLRPGEWSTVKLKIK
jgi:general stress protein 26